MWPDQGERKQFVMVDLTRRLAALAEQPSIPEPEMTPPSPDVLQIPLGEPIEPQPARKGRPRVDPPHDAWVLIHQLRAAGIRLGIDTEDPNYINVRPASLVSDTQRQQLARLSYDIWWLLGCAPAPPPEERPPASPWPAALPSLGPKQIGPYTKCAGCAKSTFVRYGGVPRGLECAKALAALLRWGSLVGPAEEEGDATP